MPRRCCTEMGLRESVIDAYPKHRSVKKVIRPFLSYERLRRVATGVKSEKIGNGLYRLTAEGMTIEAMYYWAECIRMELPAWPKWYLPEDGVKGKTVLDVGCGCGETMLFYFAHGAAKVVGIEMDSAASL